MIKILVPVDFSSCSRKAVNFAVQTARHFSVEIDLLHIFERTGSAYTDYVGLDKELNQSLILDAQRKLALIKSEFEGEGIIISAKVRIGMISESILQESEERGNDFIVMGTTGSEGIKKVVFGSQTADVIGKSVIPVLSVPDNYTWKRPESLLFATNHFEKDPAILDQLFKIADLYKAKMEIAVFTDQVKDPAITYVEHNYKILEYERFLKDHYKKTRIDVTHLYGKDLEKSLQDHIAKQESDILVMITYKRSFFDRIFHPSITKQMSYHVKVPLLAIPYK